MCAACASRTRRRWILSIFFKQKTAYEIGLGIPAEPLFRSRPARLYPAAPPLAGAERIARRPRRRREIGRAACRGRGEISGVAVSLKKKKKRERERSRPPPFCGQPIRHTTALPHR